MRVLPTHFQQWASCRQDPKALTHGVQGTCADIAVYNAKSAQYEQTETLLIILLKYVVTMS